MSLLQMLNRVFDRRGERPKAVQVVIGGGVIDLDFDDSLSAIRAWDSVKA